MVVTCPLQVQEVIPFVLASPRGFRSGYRRDKLAVQLAVHAFKLDCWLHLFRGLERLCFVPSAVRLSLLLVLVYYE